MIVNNQGQKNEEMKKEEMKKEEIKIVCRKLDESMNLEGFECEEEPQMANIFKEYAMEGMKDHAEYTFVVMEEGSREIVGFFTIKFGSVLIPYPKAEGTNKVWLFMRRKAAKIFKLMESQRFETVSACEIVNFVVNSAYSKREKGIGVAIYNTFIVALLKSYRKANVPFEYVYLYALPRKGLIKHYKSLGFQRTDPETESFIVNHVRPQYDDTCIFMYKKF